MSDETKCPKGCHMREAPHLHRGRDIFLISPLGAAPAPAPSPRTPDATCACGLMLVGPHTYYSRGNMEHSASGCHPKCDDCRSLRSRVEELEAQIRGVKVLACEWKTCDAVEMEDGEIVGPSPAIAKVLRHCADGVDAAIAAAARAALAKGTRTEDHHE